MQQTPDTEVIVTFGRGEGERWSGGMYVNHKPLQRTWLMAPRRLRRRQEDSARAKVGDDATVIASPTIAWLIGGGEDRGTSPRLAFTHPDQIRSRKAKTQQSRSYGSKDMATFAQHMNTSHRSTYIELAYTVPLPRRIGPGIPITLAHSLRFRSHKLIPFRCNAVRLPSTILRFDADLRRCLLQQQQQDRSALP